METRFFARLAGAVILISLLFGVSTRNIAQGEIKVNGHIVKLNEEEKQDVKLHGPKNDAKFRKWIVQFDGPVHEADKQRLEATGCRIGDYLPDFAFIVTMDGKTRKQVERLPFITGVAHYKPKYKIEKKLADSAGGRGALKRLHVRVDGAENLSALLAEVHKKKGKVLDVAADVARVEVDQSVIAHLAQLEEVLWVEESVEMNLLNDTSQWVIQTYVTDSRSIWDSGLHGEGQIVGIGDTGLDYDMPWFRDPSGTAIGPSHRKVAGYDTTHGDDYDADWPGHGTHVAGSVGGDRTPVDGLSNANGMAPKSKFFIQDLTPGSSNAVYPPSDLGIMFIKAYDAGARLHTNSWGGYNNGYGTLSMTADRFMWEHKDFLALFANGNSGPNPGSVINPATAKNVVSVGATLNGTGAESVTWFSSNGTTSDGRIKPTVTAPGDGATDGAGIISADSDGAKNSNNSGTIGMRGTSMATPTAAGAAALVRQYFIDGYYPSGAANSADSLVPSAALVKAMLINSAQNMTGSYTDGTIPATGQGWGRINLSNALNLAGNAKALEIVDNAGGLLTGESSTFSYYAEGNQPFKVTLVWTDFPGMEGASKALVNDLDLAVTSPDGSTTYLGNVFSEGQSTTGGAADRLNVEEQVLLVAPGPGLYTVTVTGYNVPEGPQPFALVVTGGSSVTSKGFIVLDRTRYNASSTMMVKIGDRDLNLSSTALDTVRIKIKSNTEKNGETVTLTETGKDTAIFIGYLSTRLGRAVSKNGYLEVVEGDTITAAYDDANDGTGMPATVIDTAEVDLTPPVISAVASGDAGETTAPVTWTTSEPADSVVNYGTTTARGIYQSDRRLTLQHALGLSPLKEAQLYYYEVLSTDEAGNLARSNNGGQYYTFTTASLPPRLTVSSSNGSETYYESTVIFGTAIDPSGVASVTVNGVKAAHRDTDGYYELSVSLAIGPNEITVVATDTIGNPVSVTMNVTRLLPPDLVISSVSGPETSATGETISITETVTNNGPGDARGFYTALFLSSDAVIGWGDVYVGYRYVPGLAANESSTATTVVTVPDGIAPGTYYVGAFADAWNYQFESDENNNGLAGTTISIQGPDLEVPFITAPSSAYTNETVTVENTVVNNGKGRAGGFYVAIYFSNDAEITTADTWIGYRYVGGLAVGASSTEATAVTIPGSVASGTYYIGAYADPYSWVPENSETNNASAAVPITITGPDLRMASVSAPSKILTGETVTITNTAETAGGGASSFYVGFYLSADEVIDGSDMWLGYRYVGGLAPNGSNTEDTAFVLPATIPSGKYYIVAVADVWGHVAESDETNNALAGNLVEVVGPDLSMTEVSGPSTAYTAETITVRNTVSASPDFGGATWFYVGIYLSADKVFDGSDTMIANRYVPSLAHGATSTDDTAFALPSWVRSGTYTLIAVADVYGSAAEQDETNNVVVGGEITVTGPDVTMTHVSGPASAYTGDAITIRNTVTADGSQGGVNTGFYVGLFLSKDAAYDGSDPLIGYRYVYDLPRGSSNTEDSVITLPSSIGSGTYYLVAVADVWGYLPETNEENNAVVSTATIAVTGPDLSMKAVIGPAEAFTGDTITVANTVASSATGGGAGGFYVGIYLSQDDVIDGSDMLIATRYVSSLERGGTSAEDTSFVLPSTMPSGTYYVGAIADVYNWAVESDETNNALAGSRITITGPDLTMTDVSGPSEAYTAETITVRNTVAASPDAGGASWFYVGIYLSTDKVFDGSDIMIANRHLPGLARGASSADETAFALPSWVPSGTYTIFAVADAYNSAAETNETNNVVMGNEIRVIGPDLTAAVSGPERAYTGDTVAFKNTITASASGGGVNTGFYSGVFLSTDEVIDGSDMLIAYRYIYDLPRGASNTEETMITIPSSVPSGTYTIGVIADLWSYLPESDETNNAAAGNKITIIGPDLTMTEVSGPSTAQTGDTVTINNTVAASADGGGATGFYVGFYLSKDGVLDGSDMHISSRYVNGLAAGTSNAEATAVAIPGWVPSGAYTIIAVADVYNYAAETNESNNALAGNEITVTGADLVMTAVSGPDKALTGDTITVRNTAATTAGGASGFYVGIYLSSDAVIDGSDLMIAYRYVGGLPAGGSSAEDTPVTLPSSVGTGTYYIGAIADVWGHVPESNEANNALTGNQIAVTGADLTMTAVSGPATANTNENITITNTVAAAAGGGATGFHVGFYLSRDATFDGSDALFATRYVSILPAGTSSTEASVVSIPNWVGTGTFTLIAVADVYGQVAESSETNNIVVGKEITVTGADLVMSAVSGPATALTGETITVNNTVATTAGGASWFAIGLYLSTDAAIDGSDYFLGYRYVGGLAPNSSQTEQTAITLPSSIPTGTYYLGAIADIWGHILESNETNNAAGSSATIQITGADLVMNEVSGPAKALTGETFAITNTVSAASGVGGATGFYVGFYLSKDAVLDGSDIHFAARYVPGLASGASSTEATPVSVPSSVPTGTYTLIAVADVYGYAAESNETNNVAVGGTIAVTGPDLTMTTVSGPTKLLTAENFTVSNTVTADALGGSASYSYVGFYLSTDEVIDGSDIWIGYRYAGGLAPGTSSAEDTTLSLPGTIPSGKYYFGAIADVWGYVAESNETNNALAGNVVEVVGPDLTMTEVSGPSVAYTAGTITVRNTVAASATAGGATWFYVGIYLSTDEVFDGSDTMIANRYLPGLAPGVVSTDDTAFALPSWVPSGKYRLIAVADVYGSAAEQDETNNVVVGNEITVTGPDVTMTEVSGPTSAYSGDTITVRNTVTADAAQGGVNTGFYVGLFLSADQVIDWNDVFIGYRYVYDLPRGASSADDMTITVPSSIGSGTYYLGAVADIWGYLPETNETNNALAGDPITITGADLVMNEVSGPSSALTGDTVVFRNTVASKSGTGGATGFYVGFYLSTDQVIDGSDLLIATRYVPGLGASGSSTEDTAFVLPSTVTSGDYYIGAVADVYGHVVEQDEANNTALGGSIKVTGPDLTMSSVSGPSSAYSGDAVTFTTAVAADAAGGGATGFYVGIYLSADEVIDGSDMMIATRYLPALSAGTTSTEDTTFGMPAVPTGTYYIGAIADPYGHVVESNEANNAVLGVGNRITVTGSDLAVTEASGPTSAYTGDAITVKNTVEASSNGGDASWFYVGIYLSSDDVIDTSDMLLGYRLLYGLARGTSSTDDSVVGIPGWVAPGTYHLGVIADQWNYVPESDETNNVRRANAVTITASDLTMTSVTGPGSAVVGQNITVSNTVAAGSSGGSASGFYVGIYLSSDETIDGNDSLIAYRYVGGLNKGDAAAEDTVVTVPGLTPGTYFLGAIADVFNYIPESDETNNSLKGTQIELTAQ